jgi:hypothetical protein
MVTLFEEKDVNKGFNKCNNNRQQADDSFEGDGPRNRSKFNVVRTTKLPGGCHEKFRSREEIELVLQDAAYVRPLYALCR